MMLKAVYVAKIIRYECGCSGNWPVIDCPLGVPRVWNITPCYEHSQQIVELTERLEKDWRLIANGKL